MYSVRNNAHYCRFSEQTVLPFMRHTAVFSPSDRCFQLFQMLFACFSGSFVAEICAVCR